MFSNSRNSFTSYHAILPLLRKKPQKTFVNIFGDFTVRLYEYGLQSRFAADFWQQFCSDLGMKILVPSSHQPSTDGKVEQMITVIEEALGSYVNNVHSDGSATISFTYSLH